ncbi:MAG TPA: LptF/LptG family permease [Candidatus Nitrosotenuis sp.]|jgi:lipopolysaccharide export system permease protein|nr:LptF/LptG family permease [Candidatus Nitrosotenuis sp.]
MVRLISWHVFRQITFVTLLIATVLVVGAWLTRSLKFVELIINQGASITRYLSLIYLLLPNLTVIVLPICVLLAIVYVFAKLITDNEVTIFKSCGFSNWQIAKPALLFGLAALLLAGYTNNVIVPKTTQRFREIKQSIKNEFSSGLIKEGTFNYLHGATIYVQTHTLNDRLEGVFMDSFDKKRQKTQTIIAEEGYIASFEGEIKLVLLNGTNQEHNHKTGKISFTFFKQLKYDLGPHFTPSAAHSINPFYEWSISELLNPPDDDLSSKKRRKLRVEGHRRILNSLFNFAFAAIAVAIMLAGQIQRRGRLYRVLLPIAICLFVELAALTLINLNARKSHMIYLAYGLVGGVTLISLVSILMPNLRSIGSIRQSQRRESHGHL